MAALSSKAETWALCQIEHKRTDNIVTVKFPLNVTKEMIEKTVNCLLLKLISCETKCKYRITEEKVDEKTKRPQLQLEFSWFIKLRSTSFSKYCSWNTANTVDVTVAKSFPYYPILLRMYYMIPSGVDETRKDMGDVMLFNFITIIGSWCNKIQPIVDSGDIEKYILTPADSCFTVYELFHGMIGLCTKPIHRKKMKKSDYYMRYNIVKIIGSFCAMKAIAVIPVNIFFRLRNHLDRFRPYYENLHLRHGMVIKMIEHYTYVADKTTREQHYISIQKVVEFNHQFYSGTQSPFGVCDFVAGLYMLVLDKNFQNDHLAFDVVKSLCIKADPNKEITCEQRLKFRGYDTMKLVKKRMNSFHTFFSVISNSWDHSRPRFSSITYDSVTSAACMFRDGVVLDDYVNPKVEEEIEESIYPHIIKCTDDVEYFVVFLDSMVYSDNPDAVSTPFLLVPEDKSPDPDVHIDRSSVCFSLRTDASPLVYGSISLKGTWKVRTPVYFNNCFAVLK